VFDDLAQPTWVSNLTSNTTVQQVASALTQPGLATLRQVVLYALANLTNVGVGQCANVNVSLGVAGASIGVCEVVDPTGADVILLTVSGGLSGGVAWPSSGTWALQGLFGGPAFSIGAGAQALWTVDDAGIQGFSVNGSVGGLSWCQNGTVTPALLGGTGQHCWRPGNHIPFQLNALPLTQPGVHSAYVGAVIGTPTINTGVTLGYSVVLSCTDWLSATGQACPPTNLTLPAVGGTPAVGQTLTVSDGMWTSDPGQTYGYQWLRCASSTGSCSQITGATGHTYTIGSADRNFWLTARVAATNQGGVSQSVTAVRIGPVP
jgi:hypothetical protein